MIREAGIFMYEETVVVYSDLLFLINLSLDFLCLFIADRILNCGARAFRLVIASVIGGLYSFLPYFIVLPPIISLILHLFAAALICLIAFPRRGLKKFLLSLMTFIVSSALLGGLITSAYGLSGNYSRGTYAETDALSFVVICVISAIVALSYGVICKKPIHIRSVEIRVHAKGERFCARLLVDSGNLVTEPFSSLPVIVVSSSCLPPPYDKPESEAFPLPIRAIPFSTSAGSSCFFGFRPDKIEIIRVAKKPKTIDAYIGIDTERQTYSGYDGLIPTSLL